MKFTVVTLFPQLIEAFNGNNGLIGQALERHGVEVATLNPRQYTTDAHHSVDDRAFGGSDGMVMKVEPLLSAVQELRAGESCQVLLLTPQGQPWNQALAREMAASPKRTVLICGRYAGVDQRFSAFVDREVSLGDFILNGGEVAACAIIESMVRLKPGVLGNPRSAGADSFNEGLLECPQFTRPREIEGMKVPAPLLSGHHAQVREFERAVSRVRTQWLRPDLLQTDLRADVAKLQALEDAELKALGLTRATLQSLGGA